MEDGISVRLERTVLTATAERGAETRIDLDEETHVDDFSVPLPGGHYRDLLPSAWEILAAELEVDAAVGPIDADTDVAVPEAPLPEQGGGVPRGIGSMLDLSTSAARPRTDRSYAARREENRSYRPAEMRDVEAVAPVMRPVEPERQVRDPAEEPAPAPRAEVRGSEIRYRPAVSTTAMDAILDAVRAGEMTATVVEQPFYSPVEEDGAAEGWNAGYWFVALGADGQGFDPMRTELVLDGEPAQRGIAEMEVSAADELTFDADDGYTCGAYEPGDEIVGAWEDRYRWFDDDRSRAVYAALADGKRFHGSSLDLSGGLEQVRDAYVDDFGAAPEQRFDNVVHRPG